MMIMLTMISYTMTVIVMMISLMMFLLIIQSLSAKKTWKMLNNKIIKLNYIDHFDYKFKIIIKVDLFKSYMDITHIDQKKFKVCN